MHAILWDRDRFWHLAFFADAKPGLGIEVRDFRSAEWTLSRLLQDGWNRAAVRSLFASRWRPSGEIPFDEGSLLLDLRRRLETGECRLLMGAPRRRSTAGRSRPAVVQEAWETWEFTALKDPDAEESPAATPAKKPAVEIPVLRFASGNDSERPLRFAAGADREPGLSFGGGSEGGLTLQTTHGTDVGPAFAFAGASEGEGRLQYSAQVASR